MNKVTSRDGTVIAYELSGEGAPVILVGGAFNDHRTAAPLAAVLAPAFSVITYDRRGRSESGDTPPYAVRREVEDLGSLIEQADGPAFVYGLSSGAALALEAAAAGFAIRKLALFEPPFRIDGSPQRPADYLARLTGLTAAGRRADAVEYFLTRAVGVPAEVVAQMRKTPTWPGLAAMAHTLVYDELIVGDGALPAERLAAVPVPTLVIDSNGSPDWLRQAALTVAGAVAGAQHRSLDGGFHAVPPQTLGPVLASFFAAP